MKKSTTLRSLSASREKFKGREFRYRDEKDNLSDKCKDEIFKTQLEGAQDYRTDADLHLACEPDAKKICKDVKPGEGRVQNCLVRKT